MAISRETVRHPLAIRRLRVRSATQLTPTIVRVELEGDSLDGFISLGPADHVKLFFPDAETGILTTPVITPTGVDRTGVGTVISRDYTPRSYRDGTLTIDFALHEPGHGEALGPASVWAQQLVAEGTDPVGIELAVGGPRGSRLVPRDASHAILIADETALPAVARWIEELPESTRITVIASVTDEDAEPYLREHVPAAALARTSIEWIYPEDGREQLLESVRSLGEVNDTTLVFAAGEAQLLVPIRRYLRHELGVDPAQLIISGYWKRGITNLDHHAPLDPGDPD